MMKKTIGKNSFSIWLVIACIIAFVLIITIIVSVIDHSTNVSKALEDFSIDSLSTQEIASEEFSSAFALSRKYESGTRTGVDGASKYEDSDKSEFKCKKVTGIKRISATKALDCRLIINISSRLISGNAKIVIICDGEILDYVEFGQDKTLTYDVTGEHIYSVKILAEEAELEISVAREIS